MKFIDLFSGIGGFRRGMELAGHECVGFCEWDRFATASYTSMHLLTDDQRSRLVEMDLKKRQKEILKEEYRNGEWYSADVRSITADNIPRADCWCFGAPCQDFLAIILEMGDLGYDIEWQLFNTKNFGIPQNRERVYVVGHLRTRGEYKIFPLKGTDGENSVCEVMQIGQRNRPGRDNLNQFRVYDDKGISPCLNKMDGGGREPHIPVAFGIDYNVSGQERDISNTITARYQKGCANYAQTGTAVAILVLTPDRPEKRQNGRRFKENGKPSFTLTAQDHHGVGVSLPIREAVSAGYTEAHEGDSINLTMPESKTRRGRVGKQCAQTLDCACNQGIIVKLNENDSVYAVWYEKYQCYIAIRKLTPLECFRLQGWTDEYFEKAAFVNSDSQLYKQAGNGVTVAVVEDIGKAIAKVKE